MNIYLNKYLKYKQKYLNLQKQIGSAMEKHPYNAVVKEFKEDTIEKYKSDSPRDLNTITINDNFDDSNSYDYLAQKIKENESDLKISDPDVANFYRLLNASSKEIIEIEGFYNVYKNYDGNLDEGTLVDNNDISKIFKTKVKISKKTIGEKSFLGFIASDGAGKKNLNHVMNLYKIKGVKYVMLEAAGGSDLINLYKH